MSEVIDFTVNEIKMSRQGALSAARSGRGLVAGDDLVQEASLWMIENFDKVTLWRHQGKHGQNKLRNACRQRCLSVLARERKRRSGLEKGDLFYYTPQMIREILPDVWNEQDWSSTTQDYSSERRSPSRPSEGNNRLAMIADVRASFYGLSKKDQALLEDLYRDGGLDEEIVAAQLEVTPRTVRRRELRALDKMIERLGGDPPWLR